VREKGPKLGEPCPKVRLSKDRMPVEPLPLPEGRGGQVEATFQVASNK